MIIDQTVCILESLSAVALLWLLVVRLYPTFRLDAFRQNLFSIRDQLFDYAADGHIDFSHPAYKLLRQSMNAFLRYGHQLTLSQVLLTILQWRFAGNQPSLDKYEHLQKAIDSISNPEVRARMNDFHNEAMSLVFDHLVSGSLMLRLMVTISVINPIVTNGLTNIRQSVGQSTSAVVNKLVDPRLLEEEASRYAAC